MQSIDLGSGLKKNKIINGIHLTLKLELYLEKNNSIIVYFDFNKYT